MININGVLYKNRKTPTIVVCIDGGDSRYISEAIKAGVAPTLKRFQSEGAYHIAKSVIPSYTNPNNVAIITGVPPKFNGIPGNWAYNKKQKKEMSLESPKYLRCKTILEEFAKNNIQIASVTAKDKLRLLLGKGWEGINISAELAHRIKEKNDITKRVIEKAIKACKRKIRWKTEQWMYSGNASHYTLELAVALMKGPYKLDILYVSLTDYVPHKTAPGSKDANRFFQKIDYHISELDRLGCIIGITSDHGMNAKHNPDGSPKVVWVNDELSKKGIKNYRTILPITDKYTAHHGCLGGMAWLYSKDVKKVIDVLSCVDGIEEIIRREEAVEKYELPGDLIGDVVILGDEKTVFGTSKKKHKNVPAFLRSHGSLHEQQVPFILNRPLNRDYVEKAKKGIRNFQIFDYVVNGIKN